VSESMWCPPRNRFVPIADCHDNCSDTDQRDVCWAGRKAHGQQADEAGLTGPQKGIATQRLAAIDAVEREVLRIGAVPAETAAWGRYRQNDLPAVLANSIEAALDQGFDAGWRAAVKEVRTALNAAKTEALRATR